MTFNQMMAFSKDLLGLRILYGTMMAMHGLEIISEFSKFAKFFDGAPISPESAIDILWYFFGYRSFILFVDELSKATNAVRVSNEIGYLLDLSEDIHVIASSLTPSFIEHLASAGGRDVDYVAPEPLFYSDLGAVESHSWAQALVTQHSGSNFVLPMLQNVHILASGHPWTLERLANEFLTWDSNSPDHKKLQDILKLPGSEHPALLLLRFLAQLVFTTSKIHLLSPDTMELVLQSQPIPFLDSGRGAEFRKALEAAQVTIGRRGGDWSTALAATLFPVLWLGLPLIDDPLPLTRIARQLFDTVEDDIAFVDRSVDMTVISRSHANMTVSQVFGVKISDATMLGVNLSIRQESKMADCVWEVPPPFQPGHDSCGRVRTVCGKVFDVYLQVKCHQPKTPMAQVVSSAIVSILEKHLRNYKTDPHIIFYEPPDQGSRDEGSSAGRIEANERADSRLR